MIVPIVPPMAMTIIRGIKCAKFGKLNVATNAIIIPIIPMMLPFLADFGEDNPLSAKMKQTADIR
jgi:hypothetical protein